jgi:hypothetical protein
VAQRKRLHPDLIDIDSRDQFDAIDRGKGLGMGIGHAAGTENKKTDRLHHLYPCSPA